MDILIWVNTLGIVGVVIASAICGYRVLKEIAEIGREPIGQPARVEILTRLADSKSPER